MMGYYGWGEGGWFLMAVAMVVFWGLVITGIVLLVRYTTGRSGHHAQPWQHAQPWHPGQPGQPGAASPGPEAVLAERFARGEIDEEEYRQRLAVLRDGR